jgi:hypothetical protein
MSAESLAQNELSEAMSLSRYLTVGKISDDSGNLKNSPGVLVEIGLKFSKFQQKWIESRPKEAINLELFRTKKINFKKMETLMCRVLASNEAVKTINRIKLTINEYVVYCQKIGFTDGLEKAQVIQRMVELETNIVETEITELKSQMENVNLYYQNFMVTKATRLSYVSLGISSLAFLLAIIQMLLPMLHIL